MSSLAKFAPCFKMEIGKEKRQADGGRTTGNQKNPSGLTTFINQFRLTFPSDQDISIHKANSYKQYQKIYILNHPLSCFKHIGVSKLLYGIIINL